MVDYKKQQLIGSPSRDILKRWHKDLGSDLYALDVDFVFITKTSTDTGGISAVVDFKMERDKGRITFTEAMFYAFLIDAGVPVFLVIATGVDEENNKPVFPMWVQEITKVPDWKTPIWEATEKEQILTPKEYVAWERKVRRENCKEVKRGTS